MMNDRDCLVAQARRTIDKGSQSFAMASRLFAPAVRERAWLLYAWCRAADDMTDGQHLGKDTEPAHGQAESGACAQDRLERLTWAALDGDGDVPVPFAALRCVSRELTMPRRFVADHLAGFALDARQWRPQDEQDLLRYCYHVAGVVGCMMAIVMGVDQRDEATLDRACDLGIALQLINIARDIVPDALAGRCYVPKVWLRIEGMVEADIAMPQHRDAVARMAARLIALSGPYQQSARHGARRLPLRSRFAVLSAQAVYGAIGSAVLKQGERAWDQRVHVGAAAKMSLIALALVRSFGVGKEPSRQGLWMRP